MSILDLTAAAAPRSDQLNSDDLIAGPIIIKITKVVVVMASGRPKAHISYEGDNGKPWKPCVSMVRVMMKLWSKDGNAFVGKSVQLFCDPSVVFKGLKTGGIRISHMSHIEKATTVPLTVKRGQKVDYPVKVLEVVDVSAPKNILTPEVLKGWAAEIESALTMADLQNTGKKIKTNNYDDAGTSAIRALYVAAQERIRADVNPETPSEPESLEGEDVAGL